MPQRKASDTKQQIIDLVRKTGMKYADAAVEIGITKNTFYDYSSEDKTFRPRLDEAKREWTENYVAEHESDRDRLKKKLEELIYETEETNPQYIAHYAKLLGLNAPDKLEVDKRVSYDQDALDEIDEMFED